MTGNQRWQNVPDMGWEQTMNLGYFMFYFYFLGRDTVEESCSFLIHCVYFLDHILYSGIKYIYPLTLTHIENEKTAFSKGNDGAILFTPLSRFFSPVPTIPLT